MTDVHQDPLDRVQAYRLGLEAMRDARVDAGVMREDPLMREVASQLVRAAASIPANVAEGYSRGTTADRRRFFEYALGSTRECLVWYETTAVFPPERKERLVSLRRLLLTMIKTTRLVTAADRKRFVK